MELKNIIIGDSHSLNLSVDAKRISCTAGSAKGLNNPHSISGYGNQIMEEFKQNKYDNAFFMMGQVDCDFCFIHKLSENINLDYKDFNKKVIESYLEFIEKIKKLTNETNIVVCSIGLPTIDDIHFKKFCINTKILINFEQIKEDNIKAILNTNLPNITERTKINLHFNEILEEESQKRNICFLDITSFTYDDKTKIIKEEYFVKNHHHSYGRNPTISNIINCYLSKQK